MEFDIRELTQNIFVIAKKHIARIGDINPVVTMIECMPNPTIEASETGLFFCIRKLV